VNNSAAEGDIIAEVMYKPPFTVFYVTMSVQ